MPTPEEKWTKILGGKISDALRDLAVQSIQTRVIGSDDNDVIVSIDTEIEQVTGDIKNTISETAFTREYGEQLREFHDKQRQASDAILQRNVEAVRKLVELIKSIRSSDAQGGGGTPPTPPSG